MKRHDHAKSFIKKMGYADGGAADDIEFTGSQLDDLMEGKSMPSSMAGKTKRENAAAGAEEYLRSQGKSRRSAEDAGTVFRGREYEDNPMTGGRKKTWDEKEKEPGKTKYPGDAGYRSGGAVKRKV